MHIRSGRATDVADLLALDRQCPTAAHWEQGTYQAAFTEAGPRRVVIVSEDEGQIWGFVVARIVASEWEIENIAVSAVHRRCGVGTQLVTALLGKARDEGAEGIFLEVRDSNCAARALYEKAGFVKAGRRDLYYRNPEEDAVVYRLGAW